MRISAADALRATAVLGEVHRRRLLHTACERGRRLRESLAAHFAVCGPDAHLVAERALALVLEGRDADEYTPDPFGTYVRVRSAVKLTLWKGGAEVSDSDSSSGTSSEDDQ